MKKSTMKILSLIRLICSVLAVGFAALQLLGAWNSAVNVAIPLLGVTFALQAVQQWSEHKSTAIILFVCALFIFAVTVAIIFFT